MDSSNTINIDFTFIWAVIATICSAVFAYLFFAGEKITKILEIEENFEIFKKDLENLGKHVQNLLQKYAKNESAFDAAIKKESVEVAQKVNEELVALLDEYEKAQKRMEQLKIKTKKIIGEMKLARVWRWMVAPFKYLFNA